MIYLITVQLSRRLNSTADQNFGLVAGLAAGFASGFDVRVRTRPAQRSMVGTDESVGDAEPIQLCMRPYRMIHWKEKLFWGGFEKNRLTFKIGRVFAILSLEK